jgi:TonB family protein
MREAVSEVLRSRRGRGESVARPIAASVAVHVLALVMIVGLPYLLHASKAPVTIMTVTLESGADGPHPAPPTVEPPRPQEPVPPPKRPQIVTPPATKPSAMPEPTKRVTPPPPKAQPLPEYSHPPTLIPSSTPMRTPAPATPGQALLAASGGPLQGALEVSNFCCPEYINRVTSAIQQHIPLDQSDPGRVKIVFTITRDGTLKDIRIEEPSPNPLLNSIAQSGLRDTKTVPELPPQFLDPELRFHLTIIFGR